MYVVVGGKQILSAFLSQLYIPDKMKVLHSNEDLSIFMYPANALMTSDVIFFLYLLHPGVFDKIVKKGMSYEWEKLGDQFVLQ